MRGLRSILYMLPGLPTPVRVVLALVCGASILSVCYLLGRAWWIFILGGIVLIVVLGGLRVLLKKRREKKAKPMEKDLVENSAAAPQTVSAPARRARLDDLRRNFEGGLEKFRGAGKNLYDFPWYMIVGEPGSGKTEAIRHCNVGFPPGLQDPLQGVGGTINMNWWFTNQAVILDTAGRLMFEEVDAGTTGEWKEFLNLLKTHRPNLPFNGLVLAIPADSLISDTADALERKGARIAEQLDNVQRTLGVRFPVYVVITKCDLVLGFREFFENMDDPRLQHQIMGWSNPAPLDQPFNPEMIDRHLETVLQRLDRRRLGLLLEPSGSDNPEERRIDEVDSLFAFPQSLSRLFPRLKLYLEMIFVAGAWTAKPLFLRGIYFTSSITEGSALDAELAEVLGVPVEGLPEGRVWERERAFFLGDLFKSKIFREQGLVTRDTKAEAQRSKRRAVVLTVGLVGVAILLFLTWYGSRTLSDSLGIHRDFWTAAAEGSWITEGDAEYWQPIVIPEYAGRTYYQYRGHEEIEVGGEAVRTDEFQVEALTMAKMPIKVPWAFAFIAKVGGLDELRLRAQRVIFNAGVLRPVADFVRAKVDKETRPWSAEATGALIQLMHVEATALLPELAEAAVGKEKPEPPLVRIDPLMRYVLQPSEEESVAAAEQPMAVEEVVAEEQAEGIEDGEGKDTTEPDESETTESLDEAEVDAGAEAESEGTEPAEKSKYARSLEEYLAFREATEAGFQRVVNWTYWTGGGDQAWTPKETLAADTPAFDETLQMGVERFIGHWEKQDLGGDTSDLAEMKRLIAALKQFADVEAALLRCDDGYADEPDKPSTRSELSDAIDSWDEAFEALKDREAAVVACLAVLRGQSLTKAYENTVVKLVERARSEYERLLAATDVNAPGDAKPDVDVDGEGEDEAASEEKAETARPRMGKKRQTILTNLHGELDEGLKRLEEAFKHASFMENLKAMDERFLAMAGKDMRLFQVRFKMYATANAQLGERDDVTNMAKLAQVMDDIDKAIDAARIEIQRLRELDPEARFFKEASDVSLFACRLARRRRNSEVVESVLEMAPRSAARIAEHVADVEARPLDCPSIPGTEMQGGSFDPKYSPDAAVPVLRAWKQVGEKIDAEDVQVVDRDSLAQEYDGLSPAYDKYVNDYVTYWTDSVPNMLASHGSSWTEFREETGKKRVLTAFDDLRDVGEVMEKALSKMAPSVHDPEIATRIEKARQTVQESVKQLDNERFERRCRRAQRSWINLSDDFGVARRKILRQSPEEFQEDYVPFAHESPADFVDFYWRKFALEALRLLGEAVEDGAMVAVSELTQKYNRFPLNLPSGRDQSLTPEEIEQARKCLGRIVAGFHWTNESEIGDTIGSGGETGDEEVDDQLDRLREPRLPGKEEDWVKRVREVIVALPDKNERYKCTVQMAAGKTLGGQPVSHTWTNLQLSQGDIQISRESIRQSGDVRLSSDKYPEYPGADVSFKFFKYTHDSASAFKTPDRTVTFKGPWAPILMLHRCKAKPNPDDDHVWDVRLVLKDDNKVERSLWLKVYFKHTLPGLQRWPSR